MSKFLLVELQHSAIAREQSQKDTLRGLGLRHRHQMKVLKDTPAIRGMIQKVFDLVSWKETAKADLPGPATLETYRLGPVPVQKAKGPEGEAKKSPKGQARAEKKPEKAAKKSAVTKGKKAK